MGTTIHAHIEVKREGKWLHFSAPNVPSNYLLFMAINGEKTDWFRESVRAKIQPQASIKGLPEDLSEVTAFCYKQDKQTSYLHGEGVLTAKDIQNLQEHLRMNRGLYPDCDLEEHIFHIYINGNTITSHEGWDDVRIVFWYDH